MNGEAMLRREVKRLRKLLCIALDHAEQHNEGCLWCGEGEILDGETTPEHQAGCWYYQAQAALTPQAGKGGGK